MQKGLHISDRRMTMGGVLEREQVLMSMKIRGEGLSDNLMFNCSDHDIAKKKEKKKERNLLQTFMSQIMFLVQLRVRIFCSVTEWARLFFFPRDIGARKRVKSPPPPVRPPLRGCTSSPVNVEETKMRTVFEGRAGRWWNVLAGHSYFHRSPSFDKILHFLDLLELWRSAETPRDHAGIQAKSRDRGRTRGFHANTK